MKSNLGILMFSTKNFQSLFLFRYKNTYCAQCHGVSEIAYWIMEIGCIEVGNDECSYPLNGQQNPSNLEEEIDRQVEIFINNPNATQLHR